MPEMLPEVDFSKIVPVPRTKRETEAAVLWAKRKIFKTKAKGHRAKRVDLCWAVYTKIYKFPVGPCDKEECTNQAHKRIVLNIWGSLVEYDVCVEHAHRDGAWCDSL